MVLGCSLPCALTWVVVGVGLQTTERSGVDTRLVKGEAAILRPGGHGRDHIENSSGRGRHFKSGAGGAACTARRSDAGRHLGAARGGGHLGRGPAVGAAILEIRPAPPRELNEFLSPRSLGCSWLRLPIPSPSLNPPGSVCFQFHLPSLFTALVSVCACVRVCVFCVSVVT